MSLVDGATRHIEWPENAFYHARPGELDRDAVLLLGIEPNLRWRAFSDLVTGFAKELGVELVITLGSLLADVPHTRPSPVTGAASDPKLVEELGLQQSRYEGPTGVVGVLHDACRRAGMASASLWAAVPHYVQLTPSPRAALALCERLAGLIGGEVDTRDLAKAVAAYEEQVTAAVASDEETAGYVADLERRSDTLMAEGELPSGDTLAAELTRFLRQRDEDQDGPPPTSGEH